MVTRTIAVVDGGPWASGSPPSGHTALALPLRCRLRAPPSTSEGAYGSETEAPPRRPYPDKQLFTQKSPGSIMPSIWHYMAWWCYRCGHIDRTGFSHTPWTPFPGHLLCQVKFHLPELSVPMLPVYAEWRGSQNFFLSCCISLSDSFPPRTSYGTKCCNGQVYS